MAWRCQDFITRLTLLGTICLLVLQCDVAVDSLITDHLTRLATALAVALIVLAASYSVSMVNPVLYRRFIRPANRLWPACVHASLTFLPLAFGRAWAGAAGFLAGYLPLLVANRTRRATRTSRTEGAHQAVAAERDRIARDLHDLIGHSLSMITLRSELALRLAPPQAERVRAELTEVIKTSRQALGEVRRIARGSRRLSLAATIDSTESLLGSAGVKAAVRMDCGPLPPEVDDVFATILREGVTNLLKHSECRSCQIEAVREGERVRFTVANDGVSDQDGRPAWGSGAGLASLTSRVGELGGWFCAGIRPDGWFAVAAEVRVGPPVTASLHPWQSEWRPVDSGLPAS